MTVRLLRGLPVLVVLAGVACSAPAPEPAAPPPISQPAPISEAAISQNTADTVAALNAGDATKAADIFATDGVFINARGKFDTRAGIQTFWADALKAPGAGKNLQVEIVKSGASGDMAYSLGRFTGGVTASSGYVLGVTERQSDGSLKIVVQVAIPDPPAK